MSRLGKLPILLPVGVTAALSAKELKVKGPKGELNLRLPAAVSVQADAKEIRVAPKNPDDKAAPALWGLFWSLIRNMVIGVSQGFTKKLEINGVGYRVTVSGQKVNLSLGFSHPVVFSLPLGVTAVVEGNVLSLSGADKALLGETAARIRKLRPPEPYKGKGIKYATEIIRRKAGKAAAKAVK